MNEQGRSRRLGRFKLLLVFGIFAAPLLIALVLSWSGWQPGTSSSGTPILPQRSLAKVPIKLSSGAMYAWRDSSPRFTLIALPGSDCLDNCVRTLALMRNARITLNKHADELRLLYVGEPPQGARAADVMKSWQVGTDVSGKLEQFRPRGPDSVAAVLVEANGTALTRYRAGFDPNGLKDDLQKVIH